MDSIVARILYLVESSGFTAKIIMEKSEISKSSISEWKKGKAKPSSEAIIKLANFFNVSTDYLLTGTEKTLNLSSEELELLAIYKQIPLNERKECIGYLKGYIAHGQIQQQKLEADDFQKREA